MNVKSNFKKKYKQYLEDVQYAIQHHENFLLINTLKKETKNI